VERLHYRSTSLIGLQAEMRQQDLLREVERPKLAGTRRRERTLPFGLSLLRRSPAR
jgi:hypothetical protein